MRIYVLILSCAIKIKTYLIIYQKNRLGGKGARKFAKISCSQFGDKQSQQDKENQKDSYIVIWIAFQEKHYTSN